MFYPVLIVKRRDWLGVLLFALLSELFTVVGTRRDSVVVSSRQYGVDICIKIGCFLSESGVEAFFSTVYRCFFPPIMHSLKECVTPPFHWLIHYNVVLRLGLQILVNHACRYGHSSSYIQMSHFHLPYFEYHIMQTNIELVF